MTPTNSTPANPIPPGWPDPLESPQAEAIRNGKLDDTEIRNLFDCMERELRLHRERAANPVQVTDAMVEAALNSWFNGEIPISFSGDFRADMRAALTAAIGAGKRQLNETGGAQLLAGGKLGCLDCGEPYGSDRFPDLVIDNDAFAKIAPNPPDGGLLCPNCICARLVSAGLSGVKGRFTSGPLCCAAIGAGGQAVAVTLTYTNYRGETAKRTITPKRVWFGSTEWHTEPQWLLTAYDHDKQADRDFALCDFGAAAIAHPVQPGWRDIESAPKDGTWIIAYRPNKNGGYLDRVVIVRWDDEVSAWVWPDQPFDVYEDDYTERLAAHGLGDHIDPFEDNAFTHWMPLPAAPPKGE